MTFVYFSSCTDCVAACVQWPVWGIFFRSHYRWRPASFIFIYISARHTLKTIRLICWSPCFLRDPLGHRLHQVWCAIREQGVRSRAFVTCELGPPWITCLSSKRCWIGFRSLEFGCEVHSSNQLSCSNHSWSRFYMVCIFALQYPPGWGDQRFHGGKLPKSITLPLPACFLFIVHPGAMCPPDPRHVKIWFSQGHLLL